MNGNGSNPERYGLLGGPTGDRQVSDSYGADVAANLFPSIGQMIVDLGSMVLHPIETGKSLFQLGSGMVELLIPGGEEDGNEELARAVGAYMKERYGGVDNIKHAFRTDPAAVTADIGLLLSGGAGLAVKGATTGSALARSAALMQKVGQGVDVSNLLVKGGSMGVKGGYNALGSRIANPLEVLGIWSGASHDMLRTAWQAGRDKIKFGKDRSQGHWADFEDALTGKDDIASLEKIMDTADAAFKKFGEKRRALYENMDPEKWPRQEALFDGAIDKLSELQKRIQLSSGVTPTTAMAKRLEDIQALLDQYAGIKRTKKGVETIGDRADMSADLMELHQSLNEMITYGGEGHSVQANLLTQELRDHIRDGLVKVQPEYGQVLDEYADLKRMERKIQQELSTSPNWDMSGNRNTMLRKLLQSMRDGVNTNFGMRANIVNSLDPSLPYQIAGQGLNPYLPHGVMRPTSILANTGGVFTGVTPFLSLGLHSPRIVGTGTYLAGQGAERVSQFMGRNPGVGSTLNAMSQVPGSYLNAATNYAPLLRRPVAAINEAESAMQQDTSMGLPPATMESPGTSMGLPQATMGLPSNRPSANMTEEQRDQFLRERYPELFPNR
tara:strand:+ start:3261 stop:5096 length:1836 start_codon:yes stop_codon:yes gene_type:complete